MLCELLQNKRSSSLHFQTLLTERKLCIHAVGCFIQRFQAIGRTCGPFLSPRQYVIWTGERATYGGHTENGGDNEYDHFETIFYKLSLLPSLNPWPLSSVASGITLKAKLLLFVFFIFIISIRWCVLSYVAEEDQREKSHFLVGDMLWSTVHQLILRRPLHRLEIFFYAGDRGL